MTAPSGREPARPQPGNGADATARPTAQPRLSREAIVAFVMLPVLLAAGFFLGSRLLGDTATEPRINAAAGATEDPGAQQAEPAGEDAVAGPPAPGDAAQQPPVEGPAAGPAQEPAPAGPPAPAEEPAPAGPPAPAEEPAPAGPPAPAEEPAPAGPPAPAEEPAPAGPPAPAEEPAPAQEPAPAEEPAPQGPPAGPAPQEPAPAQGPAQPAPSSPPATTTAAGVPAPQAGDQVLLFRGFAGEDVRTWQARMAERGWIIEVDGIFGPQSESVAKRFQAQKGLPVDGLVGINTWNASWTAPIT